MVLERSREGEWKSRMRKLFLIKLSLTQRYNDTFQYTIDSPRKIISSYCYYYSAGEVVFSLQWIIFTIENLLVDT